MRGPVSLVVAFALLASCSQVRPAAPPPPLFVTVPPPVPVPVPERRFEEDFAGTPPESFVRQCSACHRTARGAPHGLGPNLWGAAGVQAARDGSYRYSDALRISGLVWDDATLDKWLSNPRALVPGVKMTYSGQRDPAKRAEIIAYLKTLR